MGYFSNLAIDYVLYDHDCSDTTPEMQLLWRFEDLRNRLAELAAKHKANEDRVTFSEDNLRYVLPEHFMNVADVKAAMELAIRDLKERYGVRVREEAKKETPVVDEITDMQISFRDVLSACLRCDFPWAA